MDISIISISDFENLIEQKKLSKYQRERYYKCLNAAKKVSNGDTYLDATTSIMMQGDQLMIVTKENYDPYIEIDKLELKFNSKV